MAKDNIENNGESDISQLHIGESENKQPMIDQILDKYGYGWIIWKNIILTGLILLSEGMEFTLFSSMIIPLTSLFNLSEFTLEVIASIQFVTIGLGSLSVNFLTIRFLRPITINCSLLVLLISHILMSSFDNLIAFVIFRLIIGYALGVAVPMSINLLTEYLPLRFRASVLVSVWFFYSIGQIGLLVLILLLMPNYEKTQVRSVLLYSTLFIAISLIFTFFVVEDSPRNLILKQKEEEAFKILEKVNEKPLNDEMKKMIVREVSRGVNEATGSSLKDIFDKKFLKTTLLLSAIWIINSLLFYGTLIILPLTLKTLGLTDKNTTNQELIVKQITIAVLGSLSLFISGWVTEIPIFGRKNTTILAYVFSLIFAILICALPAHFSVFIGICWAFVGVSFNVSTAYSCEIYPTKIRDTAIGFLFALTRFGGFISQYLFLGLNSLGVMIPYYICVGVLVFSIVIVFLLPYETYGTPLDYDHRKNDANDLDDGDKENLIKNE